MLDKRITRIMKAYHPAYPENTSTEDFEYAKALGFMFDKSLLTHDEAVAQALKEFSSCKLSDVSDSFMIGLSQNKPELRAALPAYAIMTTFLNHNFLDNGSFNCADCAMLREQDVDFSFINIVRYTTGGIINKKPSTLLFCLQEHQKAQKIKTSISDTNVFIDVLDFIFESPSNEKPSTLHKKIRKLPYLKMDIEQARTFIETLGYAGILDTKLYQGSIFKHATHLTPRKTHSSDWSYPVDFWTGADGINFEGLNYWFGQYPQISEWIDSKNRIAE